MGVKDKHVPSSSKHEPAGQQQKTPYEPCASTSKRGTPPGEDPHDLRRYTKEQQYGFADALNEIRSGEKTGHWIWYTIPTPPYIVDGIERGSHQNKKYAL